MAPTGILIARFVAIVLLALPRRDNGNGPVWHKHLYGRDGDAGGGSGG